MDDKMRRRMLAAGILEIFAAVAGFAAFEWAVHLSFMNFQARMAQTEQPMMMIGIAAFILFFYYFIAVFGVLFLVNLLTGIRSVCRSARKGGIDFKKEKVWLILGVVWAGIALLFAAITCFSGYAWPVVLSASAAAAAAAAAVLGVFLFAAVRRLQGAAHGPEIREDEDDASGSEDNGG